MSDTGTVTVNAEIVFYAFRYALGRQTYAVGDVVAAIMSGADALSPVMREIMIGEIRQAVTAGSAGHDQDVTQWRRAAERLESAQRAAGHGDRA